MVPLFLPGCNSTFFHFLGLIHPFLRSTWLSRELLRRKNSAIELRIGHPFQVDPAKSAEEIVAEIRKAVFDLG